MTLSVIVAVAENGVIGKDNKLPWHIPEDLRFFKQTTMGRPVIMGRKTFESIGRPLPGRKNLVVSRSGPISSLDAALAEAGDGESFVIGGASLFAEALLRADRLYLTEVHRAYDGDVFFPDWDREQWRETSRKFVEGDPAVSFVLYDRIK